MVGMKSEVFNCDCMELMAKYPDKYFDLAPVDIPYGIGVGKMSYLKESKTTVLQKNGNRINGNRNKKIHTHKEWDNKPPDQLYFDELCRVSKHQIIFGIEYVKWEGVGPGRIKWIKGVPDGVSFKGYELAYCSMIDTEFEFNLLWSGMMQAKSLTEPMTQQGNKKLNEKRIHPCHKPTLLYRWIYQQFLPNGGKVFDSHLGGGSSRIAADMAGNIDFTGCETDEEHYKDHLVWWESYNSKLKLF